MTPFERCAAAVAQAVSADKNGAQRGYLCLGEGGKPLVTDLGHAANILIAGQGGTRLMRTLAAELYAFSDAEIVLLGKSRNADFAFFGRDGSGRVCKIAKTFPERAEWLGFALGEMERRYMEMQESGAVKYTGKRLAVFIELSDDPASLEAEYVQRIAQKGRAAGVHIIAAAANGNSVSEAVKSNFPAKILLGAAAADGDLSDVCAAVLLPYDTEFLPCRCPMISDEALSALLSRPQ